MTQAEKNKKRLGLRLQNKRNFVSRFLTRLRMQGRKLSNELPLSDHLRRDIGLPGLPPRPPGQISGHYPGAATLRLDYLHHRYGNPRQQQAGCRHLSATNCFGKILFSLIPHRGITILERRLLAGFSITGADLPQSSKPKPIRRERKP